MPVLKINKFTEELIEQAYYMRLFEEEEKNEPTRELFEDMEKAMFFPSAPPLFSQARRYINEAPDKKTRGIRKNQFFGALYGAQNPMTAFLQPGNERKLMPSLSPSGKKPLLQRANELIGGPRQADYGSKLQNQAQIAMLMQGYLAPKLMPGQEITPEDACNLLILVKLARLSKQPDHEDSLLDVAGYAGVEEALQIERSQPEEFPLLGATRDARAKRGW